MNGLCTGQQIRILNMGGIANKCPVYFTVQVPSLFYCPSVQFILLSRRPVYFTVQVPSLFYCLNDVSQTTPPPPPRPPPTLVTGLWRSATSTCRRPARPQLPTEVVWTGCSPGEPRWPSTSRTRPASDTGRGGHRSVHRKRWSHVSSQKKVVTVSSQKEVVTGQFTERGGHRSVHRKKWPQVSSQK